jgi:hypothetical protein
MDTLHKVLTGVVIALVIAGGVGLWQLVQVHEAKVLAEQKVQLDEQAQKNLDAHIAQVQQQFQSQIDAVKADSAKQVTPQQIAQWLPKQVPVPQPITLNIPPATAGNPIPNVSADIPQADLPALKEYVTQCQICQLSNQQLKSQLADTQQKLKDSQDETQQWKTVAKGTAWGRAKRTLKWLGITAGVGVVAYEAGRHK